MCRTGNRAIKERNLTEIDFAREKFKAKVLQYKKLPGVPIFLSVSVSMYVSFFLFFFFLLNGDVDWKSRITRVANPVIRDKMTIPALKKNR